MKYIDNAVDLNNFAQALSIAVSAHMMSQPEARKVWRTKLKEIGVLPAYKQNQKSKDEGGDRNADV